MELRDVLLTHVLPIVLLLIVAVRFKPISRTDAGLTVLAVASPLMFLWLVGRWHVFTVWMRPIIVLGVLGVTVMSWRRGRRLPSHSSRGVRTWVGRAVKVAVVLFIGTRTADALGGRVADGHQQRRQYSQDTKHVFHRLNSCQDRGCYLSTSF